MGVSYDGVYFYGILFDQYGEDDDPENWPSATAAVFEAGGHDKDDFDFEEWLTEYLGVAPWLVDGEKAREYDEFVADRRAACLARFGVEWFENRSLGFYDYSVQYVYPDGAQVVEWRGGRVPEFPVDVVETWRQACERLREVLPGAGEPGFHFGCRVG